MADRRGSGNRRGEAGHILVGAYGARTLSGDDAPTPPQGPHPDLAKSRAYQCSGRMWITISFVPSGLVLST
jgi:hypothetical protein